jgi:hypothetical protein
LVVFFGTVHFGYVTISVQERCILDGTLTVNYEQVDTEYRLRHNDLLANIVHRYST